MRVLRWLAWLATLAILLVLGFYGTALGVALMVFVVAGAFATDAVLAVLAASAGRQVSGIPNTRWVLSAAAAVTGRIFNLARRTLRSIRPAGARATSSSTLAQLLVLTPTEFELAVGHGLRRRGYRDVTHAGGPGDLAMDLRATDPSGRSVGVQCKRYQPGGRIPSRGIQLFVGMLYHHGLERGIFVTTAGFTADAPALAAARGIEAVGGERLVAWLAGR